MKKIVIGAVIVVGIGLAGYFYVFHKPHRDIANEEATLAISASDLKLAFVENNDKASEMYLDKVVAVTGVVLKIEVGSLGLDGAVNASFNDLDISQFQEGDEVTLKGRVLGYDDLFDEVKLDNAKVN